MSTNKFIVVCLLSTAMIGSFCVHAYCQEIIETNVAKKIEGEITSIDDIKQAIVVKWLSSEPEIANHETTFLVDSSAKIIKGTDQIGFMDLNQFDHVTIIYTVSSDLTRKVIKIDVAESD